MRLVRGMRDEMPPWRTGCTVPELRPGTVCLRGAHGVPEFCHHVHRYLDPVEQAREGTDRIPPARSQCAADGCTIPDCDTDGIPAGCQLLRPPSPFEEGSRET